VQTFREGFHANLASACQGSKNGSHRPRQNYFEMPVSRAIVFPVIRERARPCQAFSRASKELEKRLRQLRVAMEMRIDELGRQD
jgi:hypothetical protein